MHAKWCECQRCTVRVIAGEDERAVMVKSWIAAMGQAKKPGRRVVGADDVRRPVT